MNPDDSDEVMPLPTDPKTIYLGGIFLIALMSALYIAAEIVWPLVFAFMLSLLLKPVQLVVGLGTALSGPAATWPASFPAVSRGL